MVICLDNIALVGVYFSCSWFWCFMNTLELMGDVPPIQKTVCWLWPASLINVSLFLSCFFTHSTIANQQVRYRDLHFLKWIRKTIQSTSCAPTSRLKHRNKSIMSLVVKQYSRVKQTDGGWFTSLRIFLETKLIILIFSEDGNPSHLHVRPICLPLHYNIKEQILVNF